MVVIIENNLKFQEFNIGNNGANMIANKAIGFNECPYISDSIEKIYLDVPFSKKDEIKKMGGRWDMALKKWYIFDNNCDRKFILDNFQQNFRYEHIGNKLLPNPNK